MLLEILRCKFCFVSGFPTNFRTLRGHPILAIKKWGSSLPT